MRKKTHSRSPRPDTLLRKAWPLRRRNGLALWFETDDFDDAVRRAEELRADVVRPPHRNPPDGPGGPAHRELWLSDPDGYLVVIASPDGESAWPDPRV